MRVPGTLGVRIHPEKDTSPLKDIMHTHIHTLIQTYGQSGVINSPISIFLEGPFKQFTCLISIFLRASSPSNRPF